MNTQFVHITELDDQTEGYWVNLNHVLFITRVKDLTGRMVSKIVFAGEDTNGYILTAQTPEQILLGKTRV